MDGRLVVTRRAASLFDLPDDTPGDMREAVKALIVANQYLEIELEKARAAVSMGYARGRLAEATKTLPKDRKDWYD